jgi:hypothetical protein
LKEKQEKLLDLKLDEVIDEKMYLYKYNQIENSKKDLLEEINNLKNDNSKEKTQIMFELAGSLYKSYNMVNVE